MQSNLSFILSKIDTIDPIHSKKLRKTIEPAGPDYLMKVEEFLQKYIAYLNCVNKSIDYGIECYLRVCADMIHEKIRFIETGEYSYSSFSDVNKHVYGNPQIMEYHMLGLLLSQYLWTQHYKMLLFFKKSLLKNCSDVKRYLEVGGGHGLQVSEALNILSDTAIIDVVDISQSSIDIARRFVNNDKVNYHISDIYLYNADVQYDFITMGEVLEHVEDPVKLLRKIKSLVCDNGHVFITAPANAPSIDHIYLFNNVEEIKKIISEAEFQIVDDLYIYAEDIPEERARKLKVTLVYGALLSKK